MLSGLISALLTLYGVAALWAWRSYRMAMKRAHRAILDSQKRVLSNAEEDRARIEVELVGIESEIDGLMGHDLGAAIDDAFDGEPLPSDDADGEG
jgi:hypothetical protein